MELLVAGFSIVIAVCALFVSVKSWLASKDAVRAALYEQRFEVYSDTASFIGAWMRDGTPDLNNELPKLIGAWSRSQFLFDQKITDHIRIIWVDAVQADLADRTMRGNIEGDYNEAVEINHALLKKHALDTQNLRDVFSSSLSVRT